MQKKWLKNLRKNISKIQKILGDKKEKKGHLEEENYQEDSQQESYLGGQTRDIIRNIGQSQRGIGDIGKKVELEGEEQQRQLKRKKKKLTRKIQDLENGQKKMTMKWEILETYMMNCEKSLEQEILREKWCYNLAKQLSHYLYIFLFSFRLTTQGRSVGKCHMTNVTYHKSHDKCGRVGHKPCSSCISSIQNPMEIPLSSPCQLKLGV